MNPLEAIIALLQILWVQILIILFICAEITCTALTGKELIYFLARKLFIKSQRQSGTHIIDIPLHYQAHLIGEGLKEGALFQVVSSSPLVPSSDYFALTTREAKAPVGTKFILKTIHQTTFELEPQDSNSYQLPK